MLVQNFLEQSSTRFPDKIALICNDQRLTYKEINNASDKLAYSLTKEGIKKQDRVVIFLDNSVEAVISLFGILKAGCVFIVLNPTMKSKKLNFILKNSDATALITHVSKEKIINNAITDTDCLKNIYWCQTDNDFTDEIESNANRINSINWNSIFLPTFSPENKYLPRLIDIDIATIIYTSGSTGEPKGVVSAHYNVVAATRSITTYLENATNDIILSALPLSFDYGLYQLLMSVYFGGTIVLERSFTYPMKIIERLIQEKVTGFPIVPTMVSLLLKIEKLPEFNLSSLRYITNTAAALPVSHIKKLVSVFPDVKIYSMYGLTECKRVSYLPPDLIRDHPDSVGIPMPNLEVLIVDPEGEEVGPDEIGELVVRGSTVMQGYWNAPKVTARVFRPGKTRNEALLYSGDLFKRDRQGLLYFVSRKDDMIKTKGERVSPKEIENVLADLDGVFECAVIGVPDEVSGAVIKAFIVKKDNHELTEKDVMRYCSLNVEPFMVPKYIEFVEEFEKSNSGKIHKKILN